MTTKIEQESVNRNLKLIVKSSFIIFIGLFLSKIFTYLYRIIIARSFGPEVYGLFSLAVMVTSLFLVFASLGFSEGLLRYVPWYRGKKEYFKINYLVRFLSISSFFLGLISGILLFFLSEFISINIFHNIDLIIFLKVFSFVIPFYLLANIFISLLQAYEEIKWYSFILNIFHPSTKVFLIIALIFLGLQTNAIIFSYILGVFIMFLLSYFVAKHKFPKIFTNLNLNRKIKRAISKEFIAYSWPLLFSGIIFNIFYWLDSFFIGYFRGVLDVGLYNAAVPIVLLLAFVPEIFIKLFFPLITKEFSKSKIEVVRQLSFQVSKWIFILNLPIFLIMFLFPGAIINILFGSEYLPATNALKILSVGGFISSLTWVSNSLLLMKGKSKLLLVNLIIVSLINIFLNILLIPLYGIEGAALSTTFSRIFLSIILFVEAKYYLSFVTLKKIILKVVLVSIIPLICLYYLKQIIPSSFLGLIFSGIFFILVYILLIFLTNCLDKNDFMVLKAIKRKVFINK